MRRSRGTLYMVIGLLLLLIAGGLFVRNMSEEEMAEVYSIQTLEQIQKFIPTLEEKSETMLAAASNPDKTALIAAQTAEAKARRPWAVGSSKAPKGEATMGR